MNRTASLVVGLFALSVAACSSSSSSPSTTTDTGVSDTGGETSTGPTADEACTASAQAQCNRRDACSDNHYLITRTYGDMATCVSRLHDACMAGLSAKGSGNTPENVVACANAYASISCADYLNTNTDAFPAACQPQKGTLADGAACRFNGQCQSTHCNVPFGSQCGTCGALPNVGDACNGPGGVSACGGHLLDCVGDVSNSTSFTAGTCATFITTAGATCDATHPCGSGFTCSGATGAKTCQVAGTAGAACGGTNPGCDGQKGYACNQVTKQCEAITVAAAGTACGTGSDGSFTNCKGNGDCEGATAGSNQGTCRDSAPDTSSCDVTVGPNCGAASTCVTGGGTATSGTCMFPSDTSCH